jgi:sugar phosphate isomerase/epimerase
VTQPGIPNDYCLSTACYGTRLRTIEDQAFAAVAMGFRRIELGLSDAPVPLNGFEDTRRETGLEVRSLVCGCLDPRSEHMSGTRLGSLDEDQRERALISVRRHLQVAQRYGCPTVVLRGCELENPPLVREADDLWSRYLREGHSDELAGEIQAFVHRAQRKSQRQLEHLCRSIHALMTQFPETRIALETGPQLADLLHHEALGWVLDDLAKYGLGYWHDTGTVHVRELCGLPAQGQWLDSYAGRLLGMHVQDAAGFEVGMPPGCGEVDFRLLADYLPSTAERVVEIDPRHGRTEILGAVQFLADKGF